MRKDGGPAFPESYVGNDAPYEGIGDGMTLLDYYAAIAFGVLVQAHVDQSIDQLSKLVIADESYSYAHFMVARRGK